MTDTDKQTEEKIFDAAAEVFVEKGSDGARMQDIADRAGINKALLHYYYRTKDHLFDAVFQKVAGIVFKKFAPVFDENLNLEDKIRFFYKKHIEFMSENPKLPAFVLNEINRNPGRIKKLIRNVDFLQFWTMLEKQHHDELTRYDITLETVPQLMTTIASLSVFPFAARGVIETILATVDISFEDYIEQRKEFAAEFVIGALKSREKQKNKIS
ncbi:MAG TPA: TetR/AcrR family transcriptional regulator [Bacteroidales bacterium]|nr:TetR/AcrR family transcriptional regulator [Bacteroidales bacterium]